MVAEVYSDGCRLGCFSGCRCTNKLVHLFDPVSKSSKKFWASSDLNMNSISCLLTGNSNFGREHINLSIHRRIGNLKNTHVGDHQRVHTSEGPFIGTLSIHRNPIHTSEHAIHTSEDSPYIGASMYGPSSDVWTILRCLDHPPMSGHVYTLPFW